MHALQKVTAGGCRSLGLLWGGLSRMALGAWSGAEGGNFCVRVEGKNGVKTGCREAASSHLAFVSPLQLVLWLLQQHGRCNRYQGGDFPQRAYLG